jgi:hypothetical protein
MAARSQYTKKRAKQTQSTLAFIGEAGGLICVGILVAELLRGLLLASSLKIKMVGSLFLAGDVDKRKD